MLQLQILICSLTTIAMAMLSESRTFPDRPLSEEFFSFITTTMAILSESSTPPDRPADLSEDFFSFITTTTAIFPESRIPSEKSGNLSEESSEQSQPAQAKGATPLVSVGPQRYIVVIGAFCALCASFGWRSGKSWALPFSSCSNISQLGPFSASAWVLFNTCENCHSS